MKIKENYQFLDMEFAGILVPVGEERRKRNRVITMNDESACLIKALREDRSIDELTEIMMQEYDVDLDTVKRDIREILKKMDAMDLLAG